MKQLHESLRKDVSTNKMYPKKELIRIVKNKEGKIFIDNTHKANGRGIYIRPTTEAIEKIKKTKILQRSLKCNINDSIYDLLIEEVNKNWD